MKQSFKNSITQIGSRIPVGTSGSVLFVDSNGKLAQDNSNLFWDDINNRLGIGTTTPTTKIHTYRNSPGDNETASITIDEDGSGDAALMFRLVGTNNFTMGIDNSDSDKFKIGTGATVDGSTKMTIQTDGNIGIGTSSPNNKLDVEGDSTSGEVAMRVANLDGGNSDKQVLFQGYGSSAAGTSFGLAKAGLGRLFFENWANTVIGNFNNVPLVFGNNNLERMRIHTGGNIGISVTDPDEKLEVNGNIRTSSDNDKVIFGTGKDASMFYDGTDMKIVTDDVAASDLIVDCGTDKTLELTETVWDDINFNAGQAQQPASSIPAITTFLDNAGADTDIATRGFGVGDKLGFATEYLHDCKEGGSIYFHIHFQCDDAPTGTDYVKWQIDYTITADGETCAPVSTITKEVAIDTQYEQFRADFDILSDLGLSIGDQIKIKLSRIASDGDAYSGSAKLVTFGIHVEKDTMGSRQVAIK